MKVANYLCPECWNKIVLPSLWSKLEREWRHQLAASDWATIVAWYEYEVETLHPTRRTEACLLLECVGEAWDP